jgi:NADP-dependent 3-hydroxy acid dehydrogenase YdfG
VNAAARDTISSRTAFNANRLGDFDWRVTPILDSNSVKLGPGDSAVDGDDTEPEALSIALVGAADPVLRAIGQSLARGGADLILIDVQEDGLASTRAEIEAASEHSQVIVHVVDSESASCARDLRAVISSTVESLDAVVVSIGDQSVTGLLSQVEPQDWLRVLNAGIVRLSLAVTALAPALRNGSSGKLIALVVESAGTRSTVSQVISPMIERYVSLITEELATAGLSAEILRTSADPFALFGATTTRIVEAIRESAARRVAAPVEAAPERAPALAPATNPEIAQRVGADERDRMREKLGAMYRRRSNAMQKKRELGDAWTPRFEAAYQEILGEIAQLEQQMGLPASQAATSLRSRGKPEAK